MMPRVATSALAHLAYVCARERSSARARDEREDDNINLPPVLVSSIYS